MTEAVMYTMVTFGAIVLAFIGTAVVTFAIHKDSGGGVVLGAGLVCLAAYIFTIYHG